MRPHDLLRLTPRAELIADDLPGWVAPSLARAAYVVVRRAEIREDLIPVGIRGSTRAQRFPVRIRRRDVVATITPESLSRASGPRRSLPALAALDEVDQAAAALDLVWGPAGSVGFELATGVEVVTEDSDLDIVLLPDRGHTRTDLSEFLRRIEALGVRVDATIESDLGAVALREWLQSPERALVKTMSGPRLGVFSW